MVDAAKVENGKTTMADCYMINTSGKGKISGEQWQDYDEPMHSVILEAERFDITVEGCSMSLMCDLGRDCRSEERRVGKECWCGGGGGQ